MKIALFSIKHRWKGSKDFI